MPGRQDIMPTGPLGNRRMLIAALLLVLLVLGLNAVATVVIVRRDGLSAGGRAVQLLLVWLLPMIGAILCMAVATADGSGRRGGGRRSD